ncbi:cysteine desulfurase-like protein [Mesobacillus subterraneus]|uniref:cysteine desulfurase-like protein n=1 Tax=Mesobacillus subterraneus TaxID=285983 RepID=UPI00203F4B25|nr:cysteine desulfurase-like protein [Mesobacillus subterraneus]MCM3665891.1 cysteine desulfurase-like protein [Mesobacillus subterraneus]MCM3684718.1 cysteine desulfurase-like protein [Mesobacillus subterraneus]
MAKQFPIEQVRERFPALNRRDNDQQVIYFDGPGGTQMADFAIESMYRYIRNGMANLHGTFNTSVNTDAVLDEAREAVADLLGCQAKEVAFGANMTTHAFAIARSLAGFINEGDEIVVTELDHRANVDPWITLARDRGAEVKFIKLNPETFTLNLEDLEELITPKTKLVAVGMSSNVTGTVTDIGEVIKRAKEVGALVIVDAVHGVPHLAIDVDDLGCDILLCSAYKFFGPHVGIAVVKENLFEKLPVYKLQPAPTEIPYKLETGTQNHEGIAGVIGAIKFIEELGYGETRRERLRSAMHEIEEYENQLAADVESFLRSLPEVKLYRAASGQRTPTFAFTIEGQNSRNVTEWLAEKYNMCVADGDFYASTMAEVLGVEEQGGWVRIGLAPYNTIEEIQQFKQGLAAYIEQHKQNVVI